jgi:hypothetical protein
MSERIANHVARVFLAEKLKDTGEESFYGGPIYRMNVRDDEFVHFTYADRAQEILDSGKLLADPPYKKFGLAGVQAVSTVWGHYSSGVQVTHLKGGDKVAIVFQTPDVPDIGYPEEVIWKSDVRLVRPKVLHIFKGVKMLLRTPEKVPEGSVVQYK